MSETLSSLVVKLSADIAEFQAGMDGATKISSDVSKNLAAIGGAVVVGGIALAGAAIAGLGVALTDCVKGAMEAEGIQSKLAQTIANTGSVTGVTVDQINEMATAFQKTTTFEDDTVSAAGEVLARFKEIGSKVMPDAMQATLDLATVMGTDAPQAALLLGKTLADPTSGLAKLKAAGVVFTTAEEEQIKAMVAAGDQAGAQALILDKLKGSIGGAAQAAGGTTAGKFKIFENTLGGIKDTVGAGLLPALGKLADMFSGALANQAVQSTIEGIATAIGDFAASVVSGIPTVLGWLQTAWDWLSNNQGVIVAILAAIGVAVLAFGVTVATAAWTALSPLLPVIAVLGLVAAAAYLLYQAWVTDFGGIQTFITDLWNNTLAPVFQTIITWFQAQIPVAIQFLSDFWTNVLLPAIQAVGVWIQTNVIPLFQQLVAWLQTNVPIAIQALSDFWTNVLLPAIRAAWSWMSTVLFPFLVTLATQIGTAIGAAITTLAGFWSNTLLPAIQAVWSWMKSTLFPFIESVIDLVGTVLGVALTAAAGFWQKVLQPALEAFVKFVVDKVVPVIQSIMMWLGEKLQPVIQTVSKFIGDNLVRAFENISAAIKIVTDWIQTMINKLENITLPDWLTPGSPTPFELGLLGIGAAMKEVARTAAPEFEASLAMKGSAISGSSGGGGGANGEQTRLLRVIADKRSPSADEIARAVRDALLLVGLT